MIYRENTVFGKPLSVISFGGASISGEGGGYGFGQMTETQAEKLLKCAWESGINIFDTAPIYGFGLSEERMGKFLPREAIIVTKGGVDWHSTKRVNMTNEPKVIERMFIESLKRIKRDYHDVYMIHWPDSRVDIRRPMEILAKFQEKGLVSKLGLCNTNSQDLAHAEEIAKIEIFQSELNVFNSSAFENLGDARGDRFSMSWGTLDKGILSGRVTKNRKYDSSDCRSWAPWWNKKTVDEKIEKVQRLKDILSDYEIDLVQFALHYNLSEFNVSTCLIGFKSEADIVEVKSFLQKKISGQEVQEILAKWHE